MATKYSDLLKSSAYSGLGKYADAADKAAKDAADYGYTAAALPFTLKEAFDKAKDPALDAAITSKTQQVMGGAIEGLNMFKDIADPFARRALAEKYQGGLSIGLDSLTSERDRRAGKFDEYITKWGGLYGAEAARVQGYAAIAENRYNREKGLADSLESTRRYEEEQAESKRRWDIEQSQRASDKASTGMKDAEVIAYINQNKGSKSWQQMADELAAKGVNVGERSVADNELRRVNNLAPVAEAKETSSIDVERAETKSIRDYYSYLLGINEKKQAKKFKEQYDWAF